MLVVRRARQEPVEWVFVEWVCVVGGRGRRGPVSVLNGTTRAGPP